MTEHFTSAQIANWRRRNLAPAELLGADDHLAGCVECRRLVESALDNDAMGLYAGLAEGAAVGQHLSFDQSAAYVDGLLTGAERRMIEDHLASCAQCARSQPTSAPSETRSQRNSNANIDREERRRSAVGLAGSRRGRTALAPPQNPLVDLRVGGLVAFGGGGVDGDVESDAATDRLYVLSTPATAPSVNFASPTPETAPALVRLNDGGSSLWLDARGRLTGVDQWPPEYRRMAEAALSNQRAPRSPLLAGLSRQGSSLMGGADVGPRFAIIEPAGKVLLASRPAFKWTWLVGAGRLCRESLRRAIQSGLIQPPAHRPQLDGAAARARAGLFVAGQSGQGRTGIHRAQPAGAGRQIQNPRSGRSRRDSRARRDYASSHLLLGLLYARAGLLDEAEREFRSLQNANPDSDAPRKLAASVSAPRRSEAPTKK